IWNREIVNVPRIPRLNQVDSKFHHVINHDNLNPGKAYYLAAFMALLIPTINRFSNWPLMARTHFKKFKPVNGLTLQNSMNFPDSWADEPLWLQKASV